MTGNVENENIKQEAFETISNISGIQTIQNKISIHKKISSKVILDKISKVFEKNDRIVAGRINVTIEGGKVILKGKVKNWEEYADDYQVSYTVPGVTNVDNKIRITLS